MNKLLAVTIVSGSLGLAGLGIARAHAADASTTSDVDTAVTTTVSTAPTVTTPLVGRGERHGQKLTEQATKFNMTVDELQKALEAGTPMYQIAAEHGVTYASEKAERLAELKTRLDDMVRVKYMTQSEADAVYTQAQTNDMIGMGMGHGRHGMMR